jgi:hypothetical protein
MIYGSVCSGIESATAAWHSLGWRPAFFSEIEAFPQAVLAARHGSNIVARSRNRYRAIGNSKAVNVVRWIGQRIDLFEREVLPLLPLSGASTPSLPPAGGVPPISDSSVSTPGFGEAFAAEPRAAAKKKASS